MTVEPSQIAPFSVAIKKSGLTLNRSSLKTLQINIGKLCNQACLHCHVEAGPKRTEQMEERTALRLIELVEKSPGVSTVDITGGAPELNVHFRTLVTAARRMGKAVIDRCNLTVFFEKGQEATADFLARHQVNVVASLPCYSKPNVEKQRGKNVFDKSIEALRQLNRLGYGKAGSGLTLDLVYNPVGPYLPPSQEKLEVDYKKELRELFEIEFNRLFTITNLPIKRFLDDLRRQNRLDEYMMLLAKAFNPVAAESIMCRSLVSVSWDGLLYDCDFNQMLNIPVGGNRTSIWDIEALEEIHHPIAVGDHCYGCTAGSGSSCGGALV